MQVAIYCVYIHEVYDCLLCSAAPVIYILRPHCLMPQHLTTEKLTAFTICSSCNVNVYNKYKTCFVSEIVPYVVSNYATVLKPECMGDRNAILETPVKAWPTNPRIVELFPFIGNMPLVTNRYINTISFRYYTKNKSNKT